jgi:NitT/TauT family transport system substrate-binding protein
LSSITVGVLPAVNTATLYLAIKEGYFTQVGLTVTPEQLAVSTEAIPGLLHGTIDISSGNLDSYIAADAAGVLPLRILNETAVCSPDTLAVLAKSGSGITSATDLAGKTIAVASKPDIQTLTIDKLVGPAEAKTLHFVAMPFQDMLAALAAGRVDTIATLQPYIAAAEHTLGASIVLDECSGADAGVPLGGYFVTDSWFAKYPNTARAFQTAMNKAQALANSNPGLVKQILPTFMKVTPQVAKGVVIPQFATGLDASQIQFIANLAYAGGEAKSLVNVTPLLVG